jgi:hypothetical protein
VAKKLVLPRVHVMVMCDEIVAHEAEENVLDLIGVRTELRAPSFPYTHERIVVYVQVTGHQGRVLLQIRIEETPTENVIMATPLQECEFDDRLAFTEMAFTLDACVFPRPGLYYVQVHDEGKLIGERAFRVLETAESDNG